MSWDTRILSHAELSAFEQTTRSMDWPAQVRALIRHQLAHWPLLAEGVESLSQVSVKKLWLSDYCVLAQFNPKRLASASAAVDTVSVQQRPCFLCDTNLPAEEKGLAYGDDLVILCNPFPIVSHHLSIVHRCHIEQTIIGEFERVLELAKDLSPDWFILYNGPQCGASAPDHFHVQAGARQGLPLERHVTQLRMRSVSHADEVHVVTPEQYHLNLLIAQGANGQALARWFYQAIHLLTELTASPAEPLINLIVTFDQPSWNVYLFPRAKHRPACYFAEGDDKLLVSPGAIDLAGYVVVPIEAHFRKIDAPTVKQIFSEVTLSSNVFTQLVERLRSL